MQCPRCKNTDVAYFYKGSKGYYCRKCIKFKRILLEEELEVFDVKEIKEGISEYTLPFTLTPQQEQLSKQCKEAILHQDVLLHCVCGAGKTEITYRSIQQALDLKQKVAFSIPRRQVVLELGKRLQSVFKDCKVITVCMGHTEELDGDLIVLTMHQLYRYPKCFDLLIIDEADAFPYKGNEVLKNIALNSCKGHIIYTTATLDEYLKQRVQDQSIAYLTLHRRPTNALLPVPRVITLPNLFLWFYLLYRLSRNQRKIMLFVPTIAMAKRMYKWLKLYFRIDYITSETEDPQSILMRFKHQQIKVIITTTILERGITISDVDVYVLYANHEVFDEASLVQMVGRMGRVAPFVKGDGILFCNAYSEEVHRCIKQLRRSNEVSMVYE